MKAVEPVARIVQQVLKVRQKKCRSIAEKVAGEFSRGYLEEYVECIGSTNELAAILERQSDVIRKFGKYQLVQL